jgi:SAM-dependent methyltransferase
VTGVFEEFSDPRLVAVYDSWDPHRADIPFFVDLALHTDTQSVLDLGCGTGQLATELALRGHDVTGVDPSQIMLDVARTRPGGDLVRWIEGDATCLGVAEYDLAVLSGHVVQIITDDRTLQATFAAVRRALKPGGRLAFDSRNPAARCWTQWTPEASRRTLAGGVDVWFQDTVADGDRVSYEIHYLFPTGEELVSHNELRFRSYAWFRRAVADAGFAVDPMDFDEPDLVFLATATVELHIVDLHVRGSSDGGYHATVVYESGEERVPWAYPMHPRQLLWPLLQLKVPVELIYRELGGLDPDWDPHAEVLRRSETDMADWRLRDQARREQRKREFRARRRDS